MPAVSGLRPELLARPAQPFVGEGADVVFLGRVGAPADRKGRRLGPATDDVLANVASPIRNAVSFSRSYSFVRFRSDAP